MGFFDGAPLEAPADLGFSTGSLDRAAQRREDPDWLTAAREAPETRYVVLCKDTPVLAFDGSALEACSSAAGSQRSARSRRRFSSASTAMPRASPSRSRRIASMRSRSRRGSS